MKISKFHLFESSGYDHDYLPEIENIINTLRDDGFKCSVNHYYFLPDDDEMRGRNSIGEESLPLIKKYKRVYMVNCQYDDRDDRGDISYLENVVDTVKRLKQMSDEVDYHTISGMGFFMKMIFKDYSYPNSENNIKDLKNLIDGLRDTIEIGTLEITPSHRPDTMLSEDPKLNYERDDREWSVGIFKVNRRTSESTTPSALIELVSKKIISLGGERIGNIQKVDGQKYRRGFSRTNEGHYKQKVKFAGLEFTLVCDDREFPTMWMSFKYNHYWALSQIGFKN